MLLAVVSPEIRCEWHLDDWEVALVSTVRKYTNEHAATFKYVVVPIKHVYDITSCLSLSVSDGVCRVHGVWSAEWIRG